MLPILLLWAIVLIPCGKAQLLFIAVYYFWQVLVNLRGLKVDIDDGVRKILFSFV
ncbi:MAG: hypothetical protein JW954_08235 [Dehalococcoidaceae bacterium]|nr:hypothetical protein [Dehalococcoidaceae bacterium]